MDVTSYTSPVCKLKALGHVLLGGLVYNKSINISNISLVHLLLWGHKRFSIWFVLTLMSLSIVKCYFGLVIHSYHVYGNFMIGLFSPLEVWMRRNVMRRHYASCRGQIIPFSKWIIEEKLYLEPAYCETRGLERSFATPCDCTHGSFATFDISE